MKISYNWLKEYIDFDWNPQELADRLTMGGLEVEGLEVFESIPGGLEGVVTGHVLTCDRHPDADKLNVCTVDIGTGEPQTIVCGAPNVAAGQKVIVATVGATLHPVSGEPFKIKKAKIRGQESHGMICAEDEIGLGESHAGIMVLSEDTAVGLPAAEVFDLQPDHILEIGLTPNRVDAASHYGVARDVAALLRSSAKLPAISDYTAGGTVPCPIRIELPEPDRCPRYAGIYIQGVKVAPSPEWLQNRLRALGLRPINNVVDVTNFVLHELGQPLHAFDANRIRGKAIIVRTLAEASKFTTLDDQERDIRAGEDLMICDAEGPVAVAGIMGGQNSEVDESTTDVFLESAYFYPAGVRKTASLLAIKTDASYRFERGVDPNITVLAARRATDLILQLAGGTASEVHEVKHHDFPDFQIDFDLKRARTLMGHDFTEAEITEILTSLEIGVQPAQDGVMKLSVPQYRVDVQRPQDVMEEILRIYGYNNVPLPTHTRMSLDLERRLDESALLQKFMDQLAGAGWNEILTNPLVAASQAHDGTANLINNLSEDYAVLRETMLGTALEAVEYNHKRKNFDLRFMEFGKTYHADRSGEGVSYSEQDKVILILSGQTHPAHWSDRPGKAGYFQLKAEMEKTAAWFGIQPGWEELPENAAWDYGMAMKAGEKVLARFGQVAEQHLRGRDIKGDVFYAEIEWAELVRRYRKHQVRYTELSKFPAMQRDISMIVPTQVTFSEIDAAIRSCNPKMIREVNITDVYKGDQIGEGRKSYLVNITVLDEKKTLTDKTVDKLMERIFGKLEGELSLEIRK